MVERSDPDPAVIDDGIAGCCVLLVEHHLEFALQLSDSSTVLDCRREIAEGDPSTVSREAAVLEANLGAGFSAAPAASPDSTNPSSSAHRTS